MRICTPLLPWPNYSTGPIAAVKPKNISRQVSYELPEYAKVYFELGQIASDQAQAGDASFYLGKYYLYEGKLKEAEQNIKNALRAKTMSARRTEESKDLLKKIDQADRSDGRRFTGDLDQAAVLDCGQDLGRLKIFCRSAELPGKPLK